jgi:hypothetical protein
MKGRIVVMLADDLRTLAAFLCIVVMGITATVLIASKRFNKSRTGGFPMEPHDKADAAHKSLTCPQNPRPMAIYRQSPFLSYPTSRNVTFSDISPPA